ncbi:MAG: undecaprenyl/decaprenyl-phosphate alpha-N-acetylglucosaminyl 1-phosphate transferase [Anaerolineae bacterium]|jgi:UDP-GlcNAc:undecaprenyl-phosphate GlcNAc-1-phosphate transferase|nr:undecaprenyl/decaprenyl-phosphate alpha-N-acetylglucosaminyl 1-phosphate transferase [Anaerolineae bacterium]
MTPDIATYLIVFVGVLFLAVVGTPLARKLGLRMKIVDQPDALRKIHTVPTPRVGGIAIYLSTLAAALLLPGVFRELSGILIGASLVSFLGFWDDRFSLGAGAKLAGQLLAVGLVMASGVTVHLFPFRALDLAVTAIWLIGITNAINLLDNMDGLSAGISAIAAAHFSLLCAFSGQYLVGALSVAVMAACIGFLVYNWNPAMIFMGDSGTLFLGLTLASLGIKLRFPANVPFVTWMVPLLVLGVPIFDTTLVTISRLRRGLNPLTTPGTDHSSHRLTYAGLTRREAVFVLYIVAFVYGLLAIFVTRADFLEGYIVGGLVALTGLVALWRFERRPFWPARPTPTQK